MEMRDVKVILHTASLEHDSPAVPLPESFRSRESHKMCKVTWEMSNSYQDVLITLIAVP